MSANPISVGVPLRVLVIFALLAVSLLPAARAEADGCDTYQFASTTQDFASISDSNNDCLEIGVRHRYDPVWSSNNYWTSWDYTYGTYARTPETPELLFGDWDVTP